MRQAVGLLLFALASCEVSGELFTDEANARLPILFRLDDYERCLSRKGGLYCLGVFELSPIHPSPIYEHIQEYSSHPFAFNRSRLHRGYCVSERCPSTERNATVRFERCVSERAHRHALTARLHTLHHCTSHVQHTATPPHTHTYNQLTFIQIVAALLALNVLGTVYDVATGDDRKKIGILSVWSVRASWRRLTATHEGGDPRLKDLEAFNGVRVVGMLMTLYGHASVFHYQYYVTNPQFLENLSYRPDGVLMANGTSIIQGFAMTSSFLLGYNLLLYLEKHKLSLAMLPLIIIKRIARIAPVLLLVIGFTATWWPHLYSGPFHSQIEEQSAICRRKFWSHVFFYNNLVDKHDQCLMPAWFPPVDMHLYILGSILVILLQHQRQMARRVFGLGFIISSLACGVVSYITGWQAIVYFSVPENIRGFFRNVESFGQFYTSSWGSLPACFLGLYTAFLYYDLNQTNYNFNDNKWLKFFHHVSMPAMVIWVISLGSYARHIKDPLVTAAFVAFDRQAFIACMFFVMLAFTKIRGFWQWLFSWSGWRIPARLSFSVMLCHWLVNAYIVARPAAYHTSVFDVSMDYIVTVVLSHLIAVPITLLVEIPVQRFLSKLI